MTLSNFKQSAMRVLVVLVVLSTVTGAMVPGIAAADEPPSPPHRIYGTVTDAGSPVAGVNVTITGPGGALVGQQVTDEQGHYDIQINATGLSEGDTLTVTVHAPSGDISKTLSYVPAGATELDFQVDAGIVAAGSAALDSNAEATVQLGSGQNVTQAAFAFPDGTSGNVTGQLLAQAPADAGALSEDPVAAYLDVLFDGSVSGTTNVSFTVSKTALQGTGIDVENASISHYANGAWTDVETTVVSESESTVTLAADVESLGSFAISENVTVPTDTEQTVAEANASVGNDGNVTVTLPDTPETGVSSVELSLPSGTTGTVSVSQVTGPAGGAPDIPNRRVAVHLNISAPDIGGQSATIRLTVKKSAITNAGISDPTNVTVVHYKNGIWTDLDTTVVSETSTTVTLEATTDGFSPFAVAEGQSNQDGSGGQTTTTTTTTSGGTGGGQTTTTTTTSGGTGDGDTDGTDGTGGTGDTGGQTTTTTQQPTTEQPTTEQPTTEEPTTEQPTTEEPTTEEPTTDQPTTEEPTTSTTTPGTSAQGGIDYTILGVLVLVIAGIGGLFLYRRRSSD